MDGMNMSNQKAVDAARSLLERMEADADALKAILSANEDPFEGRKCNRRLKRLGKRWGRVCDDIEDWHADAEECVSMGDPAVQIGGK